MPNKIEGTLSHAQLAAMLEELKALSAKPTLAQIQAVAEKYGVEVSLMGARTFRKTTFKDHLDRLAAAGEKSKQMVALVREGGAHPLDAVEESAAADLLDLYTSGAEVDTAAIVKVALNLRASIAQRKSTERSDADLARKQSETESRLESAEKARALADERLRKFEAEAAERAEKKAELKRALEKAADGGGLTPRTLSELERQLRLL